MSSVSTRQIGGAFLLQSQRLERQRNHVNLKLNGESSVARNTKRSISEKLLNNECKQARLTPDVNGFILHADVSESAEAPHSNSSIHEKNYFIK